MDVKSEKLAYFKGADLAVPEIKDDTLAHFIVRNSEEYAPDDKIAYVSYGCRTSSRRDFKPNRKIRDFKPKIFLKNFSIS